jgi:menaquinol-cytochrome c reductase iron-sulfur subunit
MAGIPSQPASASTIAVQPQRRGFITEAAAVLVGALVAVFPFAASVMPFLDPMRRSGGGAKNLRIAPLDAVPDDGVPRRFPVVSDLTDAWTNYGQEPIGAVYLVRKKGSDKVLAFNAICPHAGCMVGFEAGKNLFVCPCHTSAFDVEGRRRLDISKVPPRDMDSLECEVRKGEVWVRFCNFQTGLAHKVLKA